MVSNHGKARQRAKRAFRPSLDGQRLEERCVLSRVGAQLGPGLYHPIRTFVKNGGKAVRILNGKGSIFDVKIDSGPGTVTARPMGNGTVKLIAFGTDATTELVVDVARPSQRKGGAHTFNPAFGIGNNILDIGSIVITTDKIGQILAYRTANLSGPLNIQNDSPINRIAFNRLLPGATITTAGDVNTLDVFVDANLSGLNTGVFIGRDLNWLNVGGSITLQDGARFVVDRDTGQSPQPVKGTDPGGQGMLITGNLTISPTSIFRVNRNLVGSSTGNSLTVVGNLNGSSRFSVGGAVLRPVVIQGTVTP